RADIYCLQEVWQTDDHSLIEDFDERLVPDLLRHLKSWLPDFDVYFRPQYRGIYGLATFVRKGIQVEAEGEKFVFKEQGFENADAVGNHARNIQYLKLGTSQKLTTIINFHGLWNGNGKGDSEDRLIQSRLIAEFIGTLKPPYLLIGDFNL